MTRRKASGSTGGPASAASDFDRLGDLLGEVGALRSTRTGSEATPDPGKDTGRRLASLWADAVGPEIAENTEPLRVKQGRLVVAASSSAWAQTLQLMGGEIKARLNALMGGEDVQEISFRHAGWEDRPRYGENETPPPARGEELSDEQRAALGEVERLDLDPDLREKIRQAMQASFGRGEQDSGR
jgi:hypothetical protein